MRAPQGDWESARDELLALLALARELGDRAEAGIRSDLGRVHIELGEWDRARRELIEPLALVRELGNRQGEAIVRLELARITLHYVNDRENSPDVIMGIPHL